MSDKNTLTAPVILLKNTVIFPGAPYTFTLSEEHDKQALDLALKSKGYILLVPSLYEGDDYEENKPLPEKVLDVACVCKIEGFKDEGNGEITMTTVPLERAKIQSTSLFRKVNTASVTIIEADEENISEEEKELIIKKLAGTAIANIDAFPIRFAKEDRDYLAGIFAGDIRIESLEELCNYISSAIIISLESKADSLGALKITERVELIISLLMSETSLIQLEHEILTKVKESLGESQKNAYLREQLRVIKQTLGEDELDETEELYDRIEASAFSDEVKEKLMKELRKMSSFHMGSPDYAVIKAYIETCLELPCEKIRRKEYSIEKAKKILDGDHDGLDDIKERILEFLAVSNLKPDAPLQVLCLVGPPGTGKTSVGKSIARAMDRPFVRVSLGGVRDESDIRGHRKTYVGSMPGRIINAFLQAKASNPVILLDEIDKMGQSHNGDPASALLEVLDLEQNFGFRDHYIEFPFDLSEALFITTANTLSTVPRPLLDRMEVIELHSYSRQEKLSIAKNHLVPKQLEKHGLKKSHIKFTDNALLKIIDDYTKEAGVRNLERKIAACIRKAAVRLANEGEIKISVKVSNLEEFLGAKTVFGEKSDKEDLIGVTNGLAYTELGGDMLKLEVCVLDGSGKLELTGSLGEVMKESAHIAISAIRARSKELGIEPDFYKTKDIHIHVPEGAVPKDGPSAGVTMFTSILSALSSRPVRGDIAMTGEITLTGRVLPIGGLKEKSMAAMSAGISEVLIPKDNLPETLKFDDSIKNAVKYIPCSTINDVISAALR